MLQRASWLVASVASLALLGCTPAPSTPAPGAGTQIVITASEFAFAPTQIEVKAGQKVTLVLDNSKAAVEHDFTVSALNVHLYAAATKKDFKEYTFDKPGTYETTCTLPGHHDSGMHGTLVVTN